MMRKVWVVQNGSYRVPFRNPADAEHYVRISGGVAREEYTALVRDNLRPIDLAREEVEQEMKHMMEGNLFRLVNEAFDHLLDIVGNVDGRELVALVLIAAGCLTQIEEEAKGTDAEAESEKAETGG